MIASMRHRLMLSLYATIAVGGLVAAAVGLSGTLFSLWFVLLAAGGEVLGGEVDFDFAFMLGAGWFVLFLVAAPVGWFGLSKWLRLRRDGPSPEEDSVAKTMPGRVIAVLIFGGVALYAGYTLVHMVPHFGREAMLSLTGTTGMAVVTRYEPAPDLSPNLTRIHYRLVTSRGDVVEDSRPQWTAEVEQIRKTDTVPVTYLPHFPEIRVMNLTFDLGAIGTLFGQYIALLAVGVWGAGKNLGLWTKNKRSPRPAPSPPPRRPDLEASRAPRAVFGRRGA